MDKLSKQQRHNNMAAIRSKDTKPEMTVRRGLWKRGFRYRLNYKRLPGHPDLVLRKYRTCIFVNGCFWHGHHVDLRFDDLRPDNLQSGEMEFTISNSACCKIPKTNRAFWLSKIRRNKERDKEEQRQLAAMGWHCITVWECELMPKKREETLDSIAFTLNHIWLQEHSMPKPYEIVAEEDEVMPMAAEEDLSKFPGDLITADAECGHERIAEELLPERATRQGLHAEKCQPLLCQQG